MRESGDASPALDFVLADKLEQAEVDGLGEEARRFANFVFRGAIPLSKAMEEYLNERSEGNSFGYDPLATTTALNVRSTMKHLKKFLGGDLPTMQDVTQHKVFKFRTHYLPVVVGLKPPTVNKHMTLLKGLWRWAIVDKRYLKTSGGKPIPNPWEAVVAGTSKRKAAKKDDGREAFTPDEVGKLLKSFPRWGSRQGDIMRLALATGCRADEIGALKLKYVRVDGTGFDIPTGKTGNAQRFIPVVEDCQKLLAKRVTEAQGSQHRVGLLF